MEQTKGHKMKKQQLIKLAQIVKKLTSSVELSVWLIANYNKKCFDPDAAASKLESLLSRLDAEAAVSELACNRDEYSDDLVTALRQVFSQQLDELKHNVLSDTECRHVDENFIITVNRNILPWIDDACEYVVSDAVSGTTKACPGKYLIDTAIDIEDDGDRNDVENKLVICGERAYSYEKYLKIIQENGVDVLTMDAWLDETLESL